MTITIVEIINIFLKRKCYYTYWRNNSFSSLCTGPWHFGPNYNVKPLTNPMSTSVNWTWDKLLTTQSALHHTLSDFFFRGNYGQTRLFGHEHFSLLPAADLCPSCITSRYMLGLRPIIFVLFPKSPVKPWHCRAVFLGFFFFFWQSQVPECIVIWRSDNRGSTVLCHVVKLSRGQGLQQILYFVTDCQGFTGTICKSWHMQTPPS